MGRTLALSLLFAAVNDGALPFCETNIKRGTHLTVTTEMMVTSDKSGDDQNQRRLELLAKKLIEEQEGRLCSPQKQKFRNVITIAAVMNDAEQSHLQHQRYRTMKHLICKVGPLLPAQQLICKVGLPLPAWQIGSKYRNVYSSSKSSLNAPLCLAVARCAAILASFRFLALSATCGALSELA